MAIKRFICPYPTLRPQMLLPLRRNESLPFPLNGSSGSYYYLARNAIYALTQVWRLAGQEVLFPAYFHGVELETLIAAGARVRFYPVHNGMCVDPDEIAGLLTSRTRAIYMIHYLGFPGPVEQLSELCRSRGISLIEDCALALLSRLRELPLGSFGDAAVFCLYKTLPLPNGGALVMSGHGCRPPEATPPPFFSTMAYTAAAICRHLYPNGSGAMRTVARSASQSLGIIPVGTEHFDVSGADLAISRLCYKIVAAQNFADIVRTRRLNYLHLLCRLADVTTPVYAGLPAGVCPLFYPIRARNKSRVLGRLLERGIEAVNFWSRSSALIPQGAFPEVDELRKTIVELPCHQDLSYDAIDMIADEVSLLRDDLY